ncbi:MAG: Fic family protein [Candidatus Dormibacteria bacterium]
MDRAITGRDDGRAGRYVKQAAGYRAFIPRPLPPKPPLRLSGQLLESLSLADLALGRLDGATDILPNPDLFVAMYVRREAVLSSQIEGTEASLADVLEFEVEAGNQPRPRDVEEVVNYVAAMNFGLARLESLPLSLDLVKEIHQVLMQGVRGSERVPGEFRRSQNWIGPAGSTPSGASYIPPPAHEVLIAMGDLEKFWHERALPPLIRAGLAHAQFETIHPFLDGNGRVGRLLVTFSLCEQEVLHRPLLYLSYHLKQHRAEYYDRLQAIRMEGHWEQWLLFFLGGVREVAEEARQGARDIIALRDANQRQLMAQGRATGNLLRLLELLFQNPLVTIHFVEERIGVSFATANSLVDRFVRLGLLKEATGHRRNRLFAYRPYLDLFGDREPD